LISRCGPDAFHTSSARGPVVRPDWDFTDTAFGGRYNADLANDPTNCVPRPRPWSSGIGRVGCRQAGSHRRGYDRFRSALPDRRRARLFTSRRCFRPTKRWISRALAEVWSWIAS
jgi:hypothetical protein